MTTYGVPVPGPSARAGAATRQSPVMESARIRASRSELGGFFTGVLSCRRDPYVLTGNR
ncbi:hypothetical protein GCM10029976_037740 [Kribbella albertanoniae]